MVVAVHVKFFSYGMNLQIPVGFDFTKRFY